MAPPPLRPSWSSSRSRPARVVIPLAALYLTLRYTACPGPADVPILDFKALEHPLFPGFAGFSIPPRARIGIVSRITTRGLPHDGGPSLLRTAAAHPKSEGDAIQQQGDLVVPVARDSRVVLDLRSVV